MKQLINMTGQDLPLLLQDGSLVVIPPASVPDPHTAGADPILITSHWKTKYAEIGATDIVKPDGTLASIPVLIGIHTISNMPDGDLPVVIHPTMEHVYCNRPNTYIPHLASALVGEDGTVTAFTNLIRV